MHSGWALSLACRRGGEEVNLFVKVWLGFGELLWKVKTVHRLGSGMVNPNIKGPTSIWSWFLKCKAFGLKGSGWSPHGVDSGVQTIQTYQGKEAFAKLRPRIRDQACVSQSSMRTSIKPH